MTGISLLFFPIAWCVIAAGRTLASWIGLPASASPSERTLIGFVLGLGTLAYGMLGIGLVGLLYPAAGAAWVIALALLGGREHGRMVSEARARLLTCFHPPFKVWAVLILCTAFFLVSLVGVYTPPTVFLRGPGDSGLNYTEWDSLAYHLADPKIYLQAHRITYLPWESHSNFTFTAEMWYTLGLMFGSVPLAKWFHLACGIGATAAIYVFGARFLNPRTGAFAAVLFAATPLIFWEAGTAYVDLASTFFTVVTLIALAQGMVQRDERWLRVAAVLMGLTIGTKALALTTLFLFAVALLYWRWKVSGNGGGAALGRTLSWSLIALAVGSPWYLKSAIYTGNPVYPFAYKIFGGRFWNQANAQAYDASNRAFGMGHQPSDLLLAPWNLTMFVVPNHFPTGYSVSQLTHFQPFNNFQSLLCALLPVLLAALFFPAFAHLRASGTVKALSLFALVSFGIWFATMQYVRYLLPVLPVFCLLSGWVLDRALIGRWIAGYALAGMTGCSVLFSLYIGVLLLSVQIPVVSGQVSQEAYLTHGDHAYPVMQYLNTQLPKNARIAFYGNPLGFYCDRDYFWADQQHSLFIPYDTFQTSEDLRRYLQSIGVTHILVNQVNFPLASSPGYPGWVYDLTEGAHAPVYSRGPVGVWALPPATK